MNVRIHTLFIVKHLSYTCIALYGEYMFCSSRPSPASVGRVAIEAKLILRQTTFRPHISISMSLRSIILRERQFLKLFINGLEKYGAYKNLQNSEITSYRAFSENSACTDCAMCMFGTMVWTFMDWS